MFSFLRTLLLFLFLLPAMAATAQVNFSNGLVAYYPFNGTFNDASGNGNNGTAMNGATFGTDQWGNANNAASFDGIDDWVSIRPSFIRFQFCKNIPFSIPSYYIDYIESDVTAEKSFQYTAPLNPHIRLINSFLSTG